MLGWQKQPGFAPFALLGHLLRPSPGGQRRKRGTFTSEGLLLLLRFSQAAIGAAGTLVPGVARLDAWAGLGQGSGPLEDICALVHDVPHLQEAGHRDVVDDVVAHDAQLARVGRVQDALEGQRVHDGRQRHRAHILQEHLREHAENVLDSRTLHTHKQTDGRTPDVTTNKYSDSA